MHSGCVTSHATSIPRCPKASTCSSRDRTTRLPPKCRWPGGSAAISSACRRRSKRSRPAKPAWRYSASRWSRIWPPASAPLRSTTQRSSTQDGRQRRGSAACSPTSSRGSDVRIAVTGAAGRIGRVVCAGLREGHGQDVVGLDVTRAAGVESVDVRDAEALTPLLAGCDAVVHLASIAGETSFETALDTHLRTTHSVLEAMRHASVPRIAYASSNHAVGFTPRATSVSVDVRPRPDTFYGVGKAAAEALCSLYAARHGLRRAVRDLGQHPALVGSGAGPGTRLLPRGRRGGLRRPDPGHRGVRRRPVRGAPCRRRVLQARRARRGGHMSDETPERGTSEGSSATIGMSDETPDVLAFARGWLADDPDPDTRAELAGLLERADEGDEAALDDLRDRFGGRLEFGTAGLRGALGAGPNRMNRVVVIRTAAGLAAYVKAHGGASGVRGYGPRHP